MSKKKEFDVELYETICTLLKQNGVPMGVFNIAKKMGLNLPKLFITKLVLSNDKKDKEDLLKNLMGLYGNYIAALSLKEAGFTVENEEEVPVYDGNKSKKVDLVFSNPSGNKVYCEVKVARQILDYKKTYIDDDEKSLKNSTFHNEIKTYQSIGRKLLDQVKSLKSTNVPVLVIILSDCYVDPDIIKQLKDMDVNIIKINKNVRSLELELRMIIRNVEEAIENKKVFKRYR